MLSVFLDKVEARGRVEGIQLGEARGIQLGRQGGIKLGTKCDGIAATARRMLGREASRWSRSR